MVLASVNHKVRDMTLKALTHLYMENIEILIDHIWQYQFVKDKYILEGIWAAAYGAVLNRSQPSGLDRLGDAIAQYYAGYSVNSIIIRSYIENIIYYLIYKKTKSTKLDFNELNFPANPYDMVDENEIEKIRGGYLYPNDIRTLEFIDMDNEIFKEELLYEHDRIIQNLELSLKSVELEGMERESFWTPEIIDLIPESDRSNFVRLVIKKFLRWVLTVLNLWIGICIRIILMIEIDY